MMKFGAGGGDEGRAGKRGGADGTRPTSGTGDRLGRCCCMVCNCCVRQNEEARSVKFSKGSRSYGLGSKRWQRHVH